MTDEQPFTFGDDEPDDTADADDEPGEVEP